MKRKLFLFTAMISLILALSVSASAANRDWEDCYRSAINKYADSCGNIYQLVDMDLNGTPELLIGSYPGSGLFSIIEHMYTCQNGTLVEIQLSDDYQYLSTGAPESGGKVSYRAYRNNTTGEVRLEGGYTLRAGAGYYANVVTCYTLKWNTLTTAERFVVDHAKDTVTYYVDGTKVSKGTYDYYYNLRNSGWTLIDNFHEAQLVKGGKPKSADITSFFNSYPGGTVIAQPSFCSIELDGTPVSIGAYLINENNYFKLRDLAQLLSGTPAQVEIGWDANASAVSITSGKTYTAVGGELSPIPSTTQYGAPTFCDIYVNGEKADLTVYLINENNYFKLRDLAAAIGFDVSWNGAAGMVSIDTSREYNPAT